MYVVGPAAGVLLVDQFTKWLAVAMLDLGDPVPVFWLLQLNRTSNTGAAFSLGTDWGPIIAIAAVGVLILLAQLGRSLRRPSSLVALGVVLGGAVSNLGDRLFRAGEGLLGGAVVDFIDTQRWPIFNVADMSIVLGAIALVIWGSTEPDPAGDEVDEPEPDTVGH